MIPSRSAEVFVGHRRVRVDLLKDIIDVGKRHVADVFCEDHGTGINDAICLRPDIVRVQRLVAVKLALDRRDLLLGALGLGVVDPNN